jgi:hypothetical protein
MTNKDRLDIASLRVNNVTEGSQLHGSNIGALIMAHILHTVSCQLITAQYVVIRSLLCQ